MSCNCALLDAQISGCNCALLKHFNLGRPDLKVEEAFRKKGLEKQPFRIRKVGLEQLQRARPAQPQGRDVPD